MKILFWTDGFWPRVGGIETQGIRFMEGLRQKGHRCAIVAQKDFPHWQDQEWYQDIPIQRFDFNMIFPGRELSRLRSIEKYLEIVMKEFQPDIVHLNACVGWHALIFLLFQKKFPIPRVVTIHAPFFYGNASNPLLEQISLCADQICCVSNWVLNETIKLIPSSKGKMRCIHNGLSMPELPSSPLCFSPPTFILIGRLTLEKGFDMAIRAFALLKEKTAKLLIVGDGEERKFMEELVETLGLQSSVHFTGVLTKDEIPSWINQATIVLVPSYFESFGLVALEAMQMGRPVIASAVGGLQEIIVHGETGLLVPPRDPEALALAMEELLANPEETMKMGAKGKERALKVFTLHQNVDQYEQIYRELTGKF